MSVKSRIATIVFTLFASVSAFADQSMTGILKVNDGAILSTVFDDGSLGVLSDGEISLKFSNANIFSALTGSRQIDIVQNGKNAVLFLEAETFESFARFSTQTADYDSGQSFEMIGQETEVNITETYKTASVSCTVAAVCTQCEFKTVKGIIKQVCKYGLNDKCSGLQDAYGTLTTTSVTPVVSIIAKSSEVEVARITGRAMKHDLFTEIRAVSECKADGN